jgi:hypothetical protein
MLSQRKIKPRINLSEISGSHGIDYEDESLIGQNAV